MSRYTTLQEALTGILQADDAVSSMVGEKIYDEVPLKEEDGGPQPPWIYLGPVNRRRGVEAGCVRLSVFTIRIFAVSTEFGRKEAWNLAEAVENALEGAEPELEDATVAEPARCIQSGDVVGPIDPKTVFVDVAITLAF